MRFNVNGPLYIGTMTLSFPSATLDSKDYPLPINNNFTINICSGSTTISKDQSIALLPGAELNISRGANVEVASDPEKSSKMYVYDLAENWKGKNYAYNAELRVVGYSTYNGTKVMRTVNDLTDATIDVNGNLIVSGKLFTTSGGANIVSTQGDGKILFKQASSAKDTTYQATQHTIIGGKVIIVDFHEVPCTSAKLRNGDGSYTLTAWEEPAGTWHMAQAGWTYTYLTEALSANREKYKDMWYLFKVTYIINGVPTVKYITTDSDTFVLDQNIPLTGDKRPVVTTNNATATLDTTSRKIVLSEINGDCIVEFTSETVYKINVSWTGNLNFEYKPNIYRWDAATMCYIREQEAGWRSNEPTVTVTNDRESGSTGNIKADVAFEKKAEFSNSDLGMNFTIGDSTTPNSVTMSDKLIPGKSVTAKMQLTGAPTGLASGANLTIGTVKIILTPVT